MGLPEKETTCNMLQFINSKNMIFQKLFKVLWKIDQALNN